MPNYISPEQNPDCRCLQRGVLAATFCASGHMTKCHYPLDCRTAGCNHLYKYYEDFNEAAALVAEPGPDIATMADIFLME